MEITNIWEIMDACRYAIQTSSNIVKSNKEGIKEVHDENVSDISTITDREISSFLVDFFKKAKIPAVLYSEESGRIPISADPKYTIVIDDLDGSISYHRDKDLLQHCTLITLFGSPDPKYKDALACFVQEHLTNTYWEARQNSGVFRNQKKVNTSKARNLSREDRSYVIIDHYRSAEKLDNLLDIYPRAWVREFGSAALHFAGVASGSFDAYISYGQKNHELGAGYLLVKEAGGQILDFNGNTFDDKEFRFEDSHDMVAAASEDLARQILALIKK